jgi:hypothetical protein
VAVSVHNPDRYMADLRTIVAQGRKRIGFLVGAGAAAGIKSATGTGPLIPAVEGLTARVVASLDPTSAAVFSNIQKRLPSPNIETILSRIRSLSAVIGDEKIDGLDGEGYAELGRKVCAEIGAAVNVRLPAGENPYRHIVNWIVGTDRDHPVEIFTTNYDMLFEEAFESVRAPYFDGFTGAREPFFDPVTVSTNDLPPRWTRLWKLHGSLGWKANELQEVVRTGETSSTHLIFPEHLKYDQTQKAPYAALFDRLRTFLTTKDTLLIAIGFSFADAHVSARVDESLSANPSASVFAFQFRELAQEPIASALALKRPNFSVYARDKAMINGVAGDWRPGDAPSRDWEPIRSTYWRTTTPEKPEFMLGDFTCLARFLALSRSGQALDPAPPAAPLTPPPAATLTGPAS